MAASAVSLEEGTDLPSCRPESGEEASFVLPSEVDCLGRPIRRAPFVVELRRTLSLGAIKAYLDRVRQPSF